MVAEAEAVVVVAAAAVVAVVAKVVVIKEVVLVGLTVVVFSPLIRSLNYPFLVVLFNSCHQAKVQISLWTHEIKVCELYCHLEQL